MKLSNYLFQWLLFLFLIYIASATYAAGLKIPKLRPFGSPFVNYPKSALSAKDFEVYYYRQTLDHFNYKPESYITFQQRYVINFKYWGGANSNASIFAYLGAEEPISWDLGSIGLMPNNAASFNALLLYIEHRYYGKSLPFGSRKKAFKDASTFGYFNSAQALADYAEVIMHVKKTLKATYSPVIVYGGSYGGLLAAWFRLKYPHLAVGALASSAPLLYFDRITPSNGYASVVTKDYREASETCYETIKKSWSEIDKVASQPDGLAVLSKRFNTCEPLKNSSVLKDYLIEFYSSLAQYNEPPNYPVNMVCSAIDGAAFGSDTLSKIYASVVALNGNGCQVIPPMNDSESDVGWAWQICSDIISLMGRPLNDTIFPQSPFHIQKYAQECKDMYGVHPRPHWIVTYYGGHDIRLVLKRFGSNIIFSNGLKDPLSIGGVLEDISDTIVAVKTVNGSHCLDLQYAAESDPKWLVEQRKEEVRIMKGWISQYYADLNSLKG